jgi:hypothetical protein
MEHKKYTVEEGNRIIAERAALNKALGKISINNSFDVVKKYAPILETAQKDGLCLVQDGDGFWYGKSPFKIGDNDRSFVVNTKRNVFYDFDSAIGGDSISYICNRRNCCPKEANDILIDMFKLSKEVQSPS